MDVGKFAECFAYEMKIDLTANGEEHRSCMILTEDLCKNHGKCPFFKTKEQFEKDALHADYINAKRNLSCA